MENTLIIFDMDGTLVDTRKDITISINFVRQLRNLPPLSQEEVLEIINQRKKNLSKQFYNTDSYLEKDKNAFERHYRKQCVKNVAPFPGVCNTLYKLKSLGAKMSVATNAPTEFAEIILEAARIKHYFDFIIGACKVKTPKPDAEIIHLITSLYNIDRIIPQKTYIVGDNYTDITAGKNAGITSVYAKWGYGSFHEDASPHFIAENFNDIINIIRNSPQITLNSI